MRKISSVTLEIKSTSRCGQVENLILKNVENAIRAAYRLCGRSEVGHLTIGFLVTPPFRRKSAENLLDRRGELCLQFTHNRLLRPCLDASPGCCQFPFRRDSLRNPRSYKVFVDFLFAQLPVVHSDDAD